VRRTRIRASVPAVALVAMVSLARADAPPDQYGIFGSADQEIVDAYTHLVWLRVVAGGLSFQYAATYCQGLPPDGTHIWRVPSYKELLTLVDEHPHFEYDSDALVPHAIDPNAFPQTPVTSAYWTSSMDPVDPTQAYEVEFQKGTASYAPLSTPLNVRCVHVSQ
jgi:hypothetical protein